VGEQRTLSHLTRARTPPTGALFWRRGPRTQNDILRQGGRWGADRTCRCTPRSFCGGSASRLSLHASNSCTPLQQVAPLSLLHRRRLPPSQPSRRPSRMQSQTKRATLSARQTRAHSISSLFRPVLTSSRLLLPVPDLGSVRHAWHADGANGACGMHTPVLGRRQPPLERV
jgi:hypothetical protein